MIRRTILVAALTALPAVALAQPAPQRPRFTVADETAAKALVRSYFDAFTAKDYAAFRDTYFTAPFVLMQDGKYATLPNVAAVVDFYRGVRDPLDQADYSKSTAPEIRIQPITGTSAFAHIHTRRLRKDGSTLRENSEMLVLAKVDGRWKISGVLPEDMDRFLPLN